jgi:hypothetical protein
VVIFRYF